jgi:hypothetical protein
MLLLWSFCDFSWDFEFHHRRHLGICICSVKKKGHVPEFGRLIQNNQGHREWVEAVIFTEAWDIKGPVRAKFTIFRLGT